MHRRNHPSSRFIIGIIVAVFFIGDCLAQEKTDWEARFFADAPNRWEEYLHFARSLQITITANIGADQSPKRSVRTEEIKQTKGAFLHIAYQKGGSQREVDRDRGPTSEAEAQGINPLYSFKLKRRNPDLGWIIMDLEVPDQSTTFSDEQRKLQETRLHFTVCKCLALENLWLPTLIQDPDFKITAIKTHEIDGSPVVRFDFDYPKPDEDYPVRGGVPIKGGWMILDPEHDWILREYKVRGSYPKEHYMHRTFRIREGTDHHPIITHNTFQRDIGGKIFALVDVQWEVVERSDVPIEEFRLSAFGLPEPPGLQVGKSRLYIWIALGGIGCLGIAALIRWAYRRSWATG